MAARQATGCTGCRDGAAFPLEFSMAFQPIVDCDEGTVFAYEALVRGAGGEPAASVLGQVTDENRYAFDQRCRVKAIETATRAGLRETGARLSINFLPNAVYSPQACIQLTLRAAAAAQLPTERLIFEFTENEPMLDVPHVRAIIACYRAHGFACALDDFGAGYAGLNLLAEFQPDLIKLDMALVRAIGTSPVKRAIVHGVVGICRQIGVPLVAEGIETADELATVRLLGIRYAQGYHLARPAFEALPRVDGAAPRAAAAG